MLAVISELGPISAADIAAHLGLTATGVRRHLDQLAEVTVDEVRAAADRWLRPRSRAAVVYRATQSQEEVA